MCVYIASFKKNRADYCGSGYIPLYPLLNGYWDKPLAEMPQTLRLRVEEAVPSWDKIYRSRSIEHDPDQLTTARVQLYDMQRDHTQERETYIALEGYIRGGYTPNGYPPGKYVPDGEGFIRGQLPDRINKIASNGMASVADTLREHVALPLEKICSEVGIHWPCTEPHLWEALCKFREMTLSALIDKVKCEKNNKLVTELGYVSTYIYRILNLERHHVDPMGEIASEWKTNGAAQALPVFVKLEEVTTKALAPKQKFDALSAEYDLLLRESPLLTATQLMVLLLANIGKPNTCILSSTGDGLQWEPFNGKPPIPLTIKKLEDRISRWRKKNKTRD